MQNPGTLNARRRTPTMKIRTSALFATAFLAATTAMGNSIDWAIDLADYSFDQTLWNGMMEQTHEFVFLTGSNLRIANGIVVGTPDNQGASEFEPDPDDNTMLGGTWTDDLADDATYIVGIRDRSSGTTYALATADADYIVFNYVRATNNASFYNEADIVASSWSGNPWTGEADPPPAPDLPTPVISAFSVTGQSAALSVANVQNGAFYAVYSSETPNGAKTLVECKQCDSDTTVEFSGLDATNSAKFFHVKGGDTQAAASEW